MFDRLLAYILKCTILGLIAGCAGGALLLCYNGLFSLVGAEPYVGLGMFGGGVLLAVFAYQLCRHRNELIDWSADRRHHVLNSSRLARPPLRLRRFRRVFVHGTQSAKRAAQGNAPRPADIVERLLNPGAAVPLRPQQRRVVRQ